MENQNENQQSAQATSELKGMVRRMKFHPLIGVAAGVIIWVPFQWWWGKLPGMLHWQAIPVLIGTGMIGWFLGEWQTQRRA